MTARKSEIEKGNNTLKRTGIEMEAKLPQEI